MVTQWKQLPFTDQPTYDESQDTLIRQSTIGQFKLCPGRVGFSDHPKHLEMLSEPLVFGTCVHHIIAEDLLSGVPQDDLLLSMNEWVDRLLYEEYDWSLTQVPNVRDFFSEIAAAYASWRAYVHPTLKLDEVLAVEQPYLLYLGEGRSGNIFLGGTADAVFKSTLMDWKTSGRGWHESKAHFSTQATLYMALHKQALDVAIRKFAFWVFNRQASAWDQIKTTRTVGQVNAGLVTAYEYGLKLEAQVFPCTPTTEAYFKESRGWYCSPKFCSAWNACDAKFLPDDVDESVLAVRSW